MNKIPMTAEGYTRLQDELKKLTSEDRPKIIEAIAEARSHGDLSENAEYQYAKAVSYTHLTLPTMYTV